MWSPWEGESLPYLLEWRVIALAGCGIPLSILRQNADNRHGYLYTGKEVKPPKIDLR
jgi:hypothetical protein